jgi:hypothetical protein
MITTTTTTDPRAALLARLEALTDAAADLRCRLEAHRGELPAGDLASALAAVEAARDGLEAARRAIPGGHDSGGLL